MTQRLLGQVVRRLDPHDFHEHPQTLTMLGQFFAEAADARVEVATQQEALHPRADRLHASTEGAARDRAVADLLPEGKEFLGRPHQVMAEAATWISVRPISQARKARRRRASNTSG